MSSHFSPLPTPSKDPLVLRLSSSGTSSPRRPDVPVARQHSRSKLRFNDPDPRLAKSEGGDIAPLTTDESAFAMPQYPIEEIEIRKKEIEQRVRYDLFFI